MARQDLDAAAQGLLVQVVLARLGRLEDESLDLERELERLGPPVGVLRDLAQHVVRLVVAQHALDQHDVTRPHASQVLGRQAPVRRAEGVRHGAHAAAAGSLRQRGRHGEAREGRRPPHHDGRVVQLAHRGRVPLERGPVEHVRVEGVGRRRGVQWGRVLPRARGVGM